MELPQCKLSSDLETRCSEPPGLGAQPLWKENFFAICVRLHGAAFVHRLQDRMSWKISRVCELRISSWLWQSAERKVWKYSGKGPLPHLSNPPLSPATRTAIRTTRVRTTHVNHHNSWTDFLFSNLLFLTLLLHPRLNAGFQPSNAYHFIVIRVD